MRIDSPKTRRPSGITNPRAAAGVQSNRSASAKTGDCAAEPALVAGNGPFARRRPGGNRRVLSLTLREFCACQKVGFARTRRFTWEGSLDTAGDSARDPVTSSGGRSGRSLA